MVKKCWLRCRKIGEGFFFSSEIAISGTTIEGKGFTLFVDKSLIKWLEGNEVGLEVTLPSSQEDEAVIVLLNFPFEMNRIIRVKSSELLSLQNGSEQKSEEL